MPKPPKVHRARCYKCLGHIELRLVNGVWTPTEVGSDDRHPCYCKEKTK